MGNMILEQMGKNSTNNALNNIHYFKNMLTNIQNSVDPRAKLNDLINSNPKMRDIMKMVQRYGNNPKDVFYALAKEKGVNPDDVLNALRS